VSDKKLYSTYSKVTGKLKETETNIMREQCSRETDIHIQDTQYHPSPVFLPEHHGSVGRQEWIFRTKPMLDCARSNWSKHQTHTESCSHSLHQITLLI